MDKPYSHLYRSNEPHNPAAAVPSDLDTLPSRAVLRVTSQTLFAGADEIEIRHQGAHYRLRQTALGKLILTK